jgi:uncharacterized Zn-finger protein
VHLSQICWDILHLDSCLYTVILGVAKALFCIIGAELKFIGFFKSETMPQSTSSGQVHEVYRVESSVVKCDGTGLGNEGGHPLIYLTIGDEGHVTCPYCSRKFVLVEHPSGL